jgi:hypothetical protein
MVAATALAPVAAAGRYSHTPQAPRQRVVVRTELVPASDGFDWLDAAAGVRPGDRLGRRRAAPRGRPQQPQPESKRPKGHLIMKTRIPLKAGCVIAGSGTALMGGGGRWTVRRLSTLGGACRLVLLMPGMAALLLLASGQASAATLNVCPSGCPYTQLAPALAVADDGDTIRIGPGTYNGGVTIDMSVKLVGAGASRTIISGGGPVVTIGEFGALAEPTVSIEGVTVTGGITRSSPESTPFTGQEGIFAAGGGVEIPPNADFSGGATVTIANSVITGNRVAPSDTAPFGPPCPGGPCPFAFAGGGGIDTWGTLTLANTTISNNRVGSASGLSTLASDAVGGAITNRLGPLTIIGSVIHGNRAGATGPNGRFAEGRAIMAFGGTLKVSNSSVTENSAALAASLPNSVELLANGGGCTSAAMCPPPQSATRRSRPTRSR